VSRLYWCIPLTLLVILQAYLSKEGNASGGWKHFFLIGSVGALILPIWPAVALRSDTLLFDGLLYDIIQFLVYALVFILLGTSKGFTLTQYFGLSMVLLGFILMRIPEAFER